MKIGELAGRAGCDVQTVRFYEREDLLEAPARDPSGYRRYGARHLTRLHFIRHCRSLDLPLPEIRRLLAFAVQPVQSCAQVNDLLDGQIALVKERLRGLKALERQLLALRQSCAGDATQACAILESFMGAVQEQGCACHPAQDQELGASR